MNSPFANIYLSLMQRIQDQVPAITYINQDLGQLKNTRPTVSWPCALIDFEDFNYESLSEHIQEANGIVIVRLGFAPYSGSSQATPTLVTEQALSYYDIEWALHKALHDWCPGTDMGRLTRISATSQARTDNYRVRELRYSLNFEDYSTKRTLQYIPAQVIVSDELENGADGPTS